MLRTILAIVAGFIVASAVMYLMEAVGHWLYTTPDMNWSDPQAVKEFMGKVSPVALLLVTLAWLLGSFAGSSTALLVARNQNPYPGYVIGAILLVMGVIDMVYLPHPIWFVILNLLALVIGTITGIRFFHKPGKKNPQ